MTLEQAQAILNRSVRGDRHLLETAFDRMIIYVVSGKPADIVKAWEALDKLQNGY